MSVISILLIATIFIAVLPLFLSVYVSIDIKTKSLKSDFYLFGIVVYKYNITLSGTHLFIKKSFSKPYTYQLKDLLKTAKSIKASSLNRISVLSVDGFIEKGLNSISDLMIISLLNLFGITAFCLTKTLKPNVKCDVDINAYHNSTGFHAYFRGRIVFNILDLLTVFISTLWGNIKNAIGKQNKQRC